MAKMKTEFELEPQFSKDKGHTVNIIEGRRAHLSFTGPDKINIGYIEHKHLERFAVNILKAIGSKKLK